MQAKTRELTSSFLLLLQVFWNPSLVLPPSNALVWRLNLSLNMQFLQFKLLANVKLKRFRVRRRSTMMRRKSNFIDLVAIFVLLWTVSTTTLWHAYQPPLQRVWWMLPRQYTLWEVIHNRIWKELDDGMLYSRWRGEYRMSHIQFTQLFTILSPHIQK